MLVKTSVQAQWSLHNGRPLAKWKDTTLSTLKIMFMYHKKKRPEVHTLVTSKILWVVTKIFKEHTASNQKDLRTHKNSMPVKKF